MFGGDRDLDTICAISTPPGKGGIHVVRLSGPRALNIARSCASFIPVNPESHRIYFGTFKQGLAQAVQIDEVLVSYFKEGRSFTGEETIEVSCHGSPFIAKQIVQALVAAGARVADRGEFTYRAFINGKLDLVQAESVLSLIESESKKASEIALSQLKGGLSKGLKSMESDILALLARLEISIDFTTEDIEIINQSDLLRRLDLIMVPLMTLVQSFQLGSKLQSGFEVVFIGEPNVGKSSLLNRILSEERAIVTDIPGTTRDLIQDSIIIKGVKVTLSDTAGIRDTSDPVEQIGVKKSKEALDRSDLVLLMFDMTQRQGIAGFNWLPASLEKVYFIGNKVDLFVGNSAHLFWEPIYKDLLGRGLVDQKTNLETFVAQKTLEISTLDPKTALVLKDWIADHLDTGSFGDEALLSQARHYENLKKAYECFDRAKHLALESASPEFLSLEVKEALIRVQETLGERFDDQVLDQVFREFCIGK